MRQRAGLGTKGGGKGREEGEGDEERDGGAGAGAVAGPSSLTSGGHINLFEDLEKVRGLISLPTPRY